jgi:hypothetical protein
MAFAQRYPTQAEALADRVMPIEKPALCNEKLDPLSTRQRNNGHDSIATELTVSIHSKRQR